jgi:hypothetical protein
MRGWKVGYVMEKTSRRQDVVAGSRSEEPGYLGTSWCVL